MSDEVGGISKDIVSGAVSGAKEGFSEIKHLNTHSDIAVDNQKFGDKLLRKLLLNRYVGTDKFDKYEKIYKVITWPLQICINIVSSMTSVMVETFWVMAFKKRLGLSYSSKLYQLYSFIGGIFLMFYLVFKSISMLIMNPLGTLSSFAGLAVGFIILALIGYGLLKIYKGINNMTVDTSEIDDAMELNSIKREEEKQLKLEQRQQKKQIEYKNKMLLEYGKTTEKGKTLVKDAEILYLEYKPKMNKEGITAVETFINNVNNAEWLTEEDLTFIEGEVEFIKERLSEINEDTKEIKLLEDIDLSHAFTKDLSFVVDEDDNNIEELKTIISELNTLYQTNKSKFIDNKEATNLIETFINDNNNKTFIDIDELEEVKSECEDISNLISKL
ncbi:MAG: hypothetical protein Q8J85_07190 [Sulfuricurvum sp.]|nr:hypothetical protein [Sulfuricurvum sp.]MDP3022989.1 hypothetical protein [Sulfuricurvum sp.]